MNQDANGFTVIKIKISLTWQLPNVISVIISELGFHICKLGEFVIFPISQLFKWVVFAYNLKRI